MKGFIQRLIFALAAFALMSFGIVFMSVVLNDLCIKASYFELEIRD